MRTVELTQFLTQRFNLPPILFPNVLPDTDQTVTGVFIYGSTQSDYVPRGILQYQFLTKSPSKEAAECMSSDLLIAIDQIKHTAFPCQIGQDRIEGISLMQYEPIYVGREKEAYLFSFNLRVFVASL